MVVGEVREDRTEERREGRRDAGRSARGTERRTGMWRDVTGREAAARAEVQGDREEGEGDNVMDHATRVRAGQCP